MASERLMGWTNNVQEPKRLNRYEVLLDDELRLTCKSVTIPTRTVEPVEIHRMHNKYKVAGSKVSYDTVTLIFQDFVDNKSAKKLDEWHQQVYNLGTSLMGFPAQYKKNITVLVYGPDHSVVESWLLVGAWPSSISREGLKWDDASGVQSVTVTLNIDEAKLVLSGS